MNQWQPFQNLLGGTHWLQISELINCKSHFVDPHPIDCDFDEARGSQGGMGSEAGQKRRGGKEATVPLNHQDVTDSTEEGVLVKRTKHHLANVLQGLDHLSNKLCKNTFVIKGGNLIQSRIFKHYNLYCQSLGTKDNTSLDALRLLQGDGPE